LTEGFNPPTEPTSGGLVLPPTSDALSPEQAKVIHVNRMVQGAPLPHQRANREAARRARGEA
jgi:hypothetical protein